MKTKGGSRSPGECEAGVLIPRTIFSAARLGEVAGLFLKLGTIAFGGPAAHVAMMEEEVVRRKGWVTREEFLDLLGATNLIPGPNSTELAIHLGHRRAGWLGLLVAGVCFILPASLIVTTLAWAYVRFGSLPAFGGLLYGVKPVMLAIVVRALWGLQQTAIKDRWLIALGAAAVIANVAGVNELVILLGAGLVVLLGRRKFRAGASLAGWGVPFPWAPLAATGAGTAGAVAFGLGPLFWFFVKVGAILFGSGYVLLAYLHADLVVRWQWLSEAQLLDAIAIGQVTPGPVFTTATFIGYLLAGIPGAIVATIGIFLPAFFFVAISGPLIPHLRRSPAAGAFLDGVNVASLALMAVVTGRLVQTAMVDGLTSLLAIGAAILLWRGVSAVSLIAAGAGVGLLSIFW